MGHTHNPELEMLEFEHEASIIAGNSAILLSVPKRFQRVPGLKGVHILRRLDMTDHFMPESPELSSHIFCINQSRFGEAFNKFKPVKRFGGTFRNLFSKAILDDGHREDILEQLSSPECGSYTSLNDFTKIQARRQASKPAEKRKVSGIVVESNVLLTRQEIIADLAHIDSENITQYFDFTLTEARAFTDIHEYQHARSDQMWANDPAFLNPDKMPPLAEKYPAYKALWQKTSQAETLDDLYLEYLEEDLSDTVAALHHLKAGGSVDLIEANADARAIGHLGDSDCIYASHHVLDEIVKDSENLRAMLIGKSTEQVEHMAVRLVGHFSMDMDKFYAQAIAADQHKANLAREDGRKKAEAKYRASAREMAEDSPFDKREIHNMAVQEQKTMLEREDQAYSRLCNMEEELGYEDHKIEVMAAIKHAQDMHPDLNTPEGARYLLGIRQRQLDHEPGEGLDDIEVCEELKDYYSGLETEQTQTVEHAHGKC